MASNNTSHPPAPSLKIAPYASEPTKESILSNLRRQVDGDSSSNTGSSTTSGRRRRRNRKNKGALVGSQIAAVPVLERLEATKPVRLQLGLNLDVELELKAKIRGDITLALM